MNWRCHELHQRCMNCLRSKRKGVSDGFIRAPPPTGFVGYGIYDVPLIKCDLSHRTFSLFTFTYDFFNGPSGAPSPTDLTGWKAVPYLSQLVTKWKTISKNKIKLLPKGIDLFFIYVII